MFKNSLPRALAVLALIFLMANASAAITVLLPVEADLSNNDELELGNAAKGETVQIVIKKKSGNGFDWDKISVNAPENWAVSSDTGDKTIIVNVSIPQTAAESIQIMTFSLGSNEQPLAEESFKGILTVKSNLLTVAVDNLAQESVLGQEIAYKLVASNDSIASHALIIKSSLPNYWFEPVELVLEPRQKTELLLSVNPKAYGLRNFSFFVNSAENDFSQEFFSELRVKPTFQGKFQAAAYAFPFYTLSNLAYYILNSLLAMPFS